MTQPDYVPILDRESVRVFWSQPVPDRKRVERKAELSRPDQHKGLRRGNPGPDQGYALLLAVDLEGTLQLAEHEHESDAIAAVVALGMKRASLFGRAPIKADLEVAAVLLGFRGGADEEMLAQRSELIHGVSHDYQRVLDLVDAVSEAALRSTMEVAKKMYSNSAN